MITVTILFKNDPSVGLFSESFKMEIPDFREDWTESDEELQKFTEEQRLAITQLYINFDNNNRPQVFFQWELEELERVLTPIEEDTFNEIVREEKAKDEENEQIKITKKMDVYFAMFNSHINNALIKAIEEFENEFGRDCFDREIKPFVRKGMMSIFNEPPNQYTKKFAETVQFLVNQNCVENNIQDEEIAFHDDDFDELEEKHEENINSIILSPEEMREFEREDYRDHPDYEANNNPNFYNR